MKENTYLEMIKETTWSSNKDVDTWKSNTISVKKLTRNILLSGRLQIVGAQTPNTQTNFLCLGLAWWSIKIVPTKLRQIGVPTQGLSSRPLSKLCQISKSNSSRVIKLMDRGWVTQPGGKYMVGTITSDKSGIQRVKSSLNHPKTSPSLHAKWIPHVIQM